MAEDLSGLANFLFEVGMLSKTPRSGFHFLGSGEQSVAEHSLRTIYAGFVLAMMDGSVNVDRVVQICMVHDLAETRVSDLNYTHKKYVKSDEDAALKSLAQTLPFGDKLLDLMKEYTERVTPESKIAKDADHLELLLSLKEQQDIGNARAKEWIDVSLKRFQTEVGQKLSRKVAETGSDDWWFTEKDGSWWVNRTASNDSHNPA
jgi:putative hydrolase of HD superfamily